MTKTDQKILEIYKEYELLLYNSDHKNPLKDRSKKIGRNEVSLITRYPEITKQVAFEHGYAYWITLNIEFQPYWTKMFYRNYIKSIYCISEKYYLQNTIIRNLNNYFNINIYRDKHSNIILNNVPIERKYYGVNCLYSEVPNFKSQKQFETINLC